MSTQASRRLDNGRVEYDEWSTTSIPHDCEPDTLDDRPARPGRNRLVGLDAARGFALIGMVAVHTMSAANDAGDTSLAWTLFSGKSSALFALLAGVGLAFMTGRRRPPQTGAGWWRAATSPIIRGVVLVLLGLALGSVVSVGDANVILPYLGLMFVMSIALVPLRARALLVIGLGWAVLGPFLSHALRQELPVAAPTTNLTVGQALAAPGDAFAVLLLTGFFPALTWIAYLCLGMALGRADLGSRRVTAWLIAGGAGLAVLVWVVTTQLMTMGGLLERLADDVQDHMSFATFTEHLLFGGSGALPTDSWWWLGVNAPHSGTPLDLLHTAGLAMLTVGVFLAISQAFGHLLTVLAAPGSMTLTLYTLHLLLLAPLRELPDLGHFLTQVIVLTAFGLLWSHHFRRGPLEWLLWKVTHVGELAHRTARPVPATRPSP